MRKIFVGITLLLRKRGRYKVFVHFIVKEPSTNAIFLNVSVKFELDPLRWTREIRFLQKFIRIS